MRRINGLMEGLELFKTLGSGIRMRIITLLSGNPEMNLGELASELGVTQGALTSHIRLLEKNGLVRVETRHSARGLQKVCSLNDHEILLNVYPSFEENSANVYQTEVPVGHYSDYAMNAGCGLVTDSAQLGAQDDPRVFSYPERTDAQMLWFHNGYVEYRIPNLLPEHHRIIQLTISVEMSCSEQGSEQNISSEITYYLNGQKLGRWLADTLNRGSTRGIYTPVRHHSLLRQHGFLKMLVINNSGVFIDGVNVRQTGPGWPFLDENGEMRFRIENNVSEEHPGGVALYGDRFGNYNQNIQVIVHYMPEDQYQSPS